ncbi:MAG TPA: hypothetical protein VKG79_13410 [Bryobacteraceae bacterium]|nr:hypothetical protein [Bryobacteraceae bacterium]
MRTATWVFLVTASLPAFAQETSHWWSNRALASPGWPFGPPRNRVNLEGVLAHSDGETLSIELNDKRVIRFRLTEHTRYKPDSAPDKLASFHVSDVVGVDAEVDTQGYLEARSVHYVRKPSADEQAEILQCPEILQRWRANILAENPMDTTQDDRRLRFVAKPGPISDRSLFRDTTARSADASGGDVIASVRAIVNSAFEGLPNFRAKQVTSMFHSASKPVKWIPDGVVAAEIAYEEQREVYSDVRKDGKRPANAPDTADSGYMRSLDIAWSTGDFETISHCVFSELEDSDFRQSGVEHREHGDALLYRFTGQRSSGCIALKFKSQIAYPAYSGNMTVDPQTHQVLHVELEATNIPAAFPLDRAERSLDLGTVNIGASEYRLPITGYWFGCFRNSYSCFLNRMDFRDYRRFEAESAVAFGR